MHAPYQKDVFDLYVSVPAAVVHNQTTGCSMQPDMSIVMPPQSGCGGPQ